MKPQADHEIEAFIHAYVAKQRAMDAAAIAADWDDDETVIYIAEEFDEPIIGVSAIARYWAENTAIMGRLGVRVGQIRQRPLGPGLVSVLVPIHWDAVMKTGGLPVGGDIKAVAVLRWTGERWLFVQWTESALGALPFLRRIYQRNASPDFVAGVSAAASA